MFVHGWYSMVFIERPCHMIGYAWLSYNQYRFECWGIGIGFIVSTYYCQTFLSGLTPFCEGNIMWCDMIGGFLWARSWEYYHRTGCKQYIVTSKYMYMFNYHICVVTMGNVYRPICNGLISQGWLYMIAMHFSTIGHTIVTVWFNRCLPT